MLADFYSDRLRGAAAMVAAILCSVVGVLAAPALTPRAASAQQPPDTTPIAADPDTQPMRHPLLFSVPPPPAGRTLTVPGIINPTPRGGYSPAQLRAYLGLSGDGRGQTIGITVAYDTPTIRADVSRFSTFFGLPLPCDASVTDDDQARPRHRHHGGDVAGEDDCFPLVIAMPGGQPTVDDGWAIETALDVEWAHAIAPRARILLVEAINVEAGPLFAAVHYAARHDASVISNSWLDEEFKGEGKFDHHCRLQRAICVFATGDDGHEATYPAVNPYVLAVGGTTLSLNGSGAVSSETAWSGSGGGVSVFEHRPRYQADVNEYRMRGSPDVSYNADIRTGYAVFVGAGAFSVFGWINAGGTSAGTPQWAAIIAVADQLRETQGKQRFGSLGKNALHNALYRLQRGRSLFDVIEGSNGTCGQLCTAAPGYDFVTGIGSPRHGIDTDLAAAP